MADETYPYRPPLYFYLVFVLLPALVSAFFFHLATTNTDELHMHVAEAPVRLPAEEGDFVCLLLALGAAGVAIYLAIVAIRKPRMGAVTLGLDALAIQYPGRKSPKTIQFADVATIELAKPGLFRQLRIVQNDGKSAAIMAAGLPSAKASDDLFQSLERSRTAMSTVDGAAIRGVPAAPKAVSSSDARPYWLAMCVGSLAAFVSSLVGSYLFMSSLYIYLLWLETDVLHRHIEAIPINHPFTEWESTHAFVIIFAITQLPLGGLYYWSGEQVARLLAPAVSRTRVLVGFLFLVLLWDVKMINTLDGRDILAVINDLLMALGALVVMGLGLRRGLGAMVQIVGAHHAKAGQPAKTS